MNKYCFVLFFFLFLFGGCNPNNHNFNEFMGIPIEGDVDEFGKKLSTRGYDFVIDETVIPALVFLLPLHRRNTEAVSVNGG